jgi:tetratricopeptide (TPR) repeat protein
MIEEFLAQLKPSDIASLTMSTLALTAGAISTLITMNAKRYEDQRQLRMTVGDLTQKILALRGEEEQLNIKTLKKKEGIEEFIAARGYNMKTQHALARLAVDALTELKRPATATEYEVLALALTANNDPAGDRFWRLAMERTSDATALLSLRGQRAYALIKNGREAEGEQVFKEALASVTHPVQIGYVHETRGKALHAAGKPNDARAAFDQAAASYAELTPPAVRDSYLLNLASARTTLGLG